MEYEFNNEFIAKNLIALVRDEGNRIVSLGLADIKDVRALVGPAIQHAVEKYGFQDSGLLIHVLAALHSGLASIKLPGDFVKVAGDFYEVPKNFPGYTGEKFYILPQKPKDEEETFEEDDDVEIIILEDEPEEEVDQMALASQVSDKLEAIAYKLGSRGNHEAAYVVERSIRDIQQLATRAKLLPRK